MTSSLSSKSTESSPSTTAWQRATELVTRQVELLNETLDHTPDTDHQHRVTFGYIGNGRMTVDGWDLSGVLWHVFLPHPGRVGTDADSLGGVTDGDATGLLTLAGQVIAFRRGVEFARSR